METLRGPRRLSDVFGGPSEALGGPWKPSEALGGPRESSRVYEKFSFVVARAYELTGICDKAVNSYDNLRKL